MSTQYRLVQSGKTASGGYSAGLGSSEPVAPRIIIIIIIIRLCTPYVTGEILSVGDMPSFTFLATRVATART
jgi:hypothetical protein